MSLSKADSTYDFRNATDGGDAPSWDAKTLPLFRRFAELCKPQENVLFMQADHRTGALFCECHLRASKIVELATTDVPLDPIDQAEYRANREIVESHYAFQVMKQDAVNRRTFSNIVSEFTEDFAADVPLKVIGGQHRYEALRAALGVGVDEYHGMKVYFSLSQSQRLDVQLISNTVIAVSTDLFDRMQETVRGPELRKWCQATGLLEEEEDFADRRLREVITVRFARTFVQNYYLGRANKDKDFKNIETTPALAKTGEADEKWSQLVEANPGIWTDVKLLAAGKEFAELHRAQRNAFTTTKDVKGQPVSRIENTDFAYKAISFAVASSFAYVAGLLEDNSVRLDRHYSLKIQKPDPLNAKALAKGRHKSDPENYRGLGYRTDPKERGRFVELFYLQAEKGDGIRPALIDLAIKKHVAKQANLDVDADE